MNNEYAAVGLPSCPICLSVFRAIITLVACWRPACLMLLMQCAETPCTACHRARLPYSIHEPAPSDSKYNSMFKP